MFYVIKLLISWYNILLLSKNLCSFFFFDFFFFVPQFEIPWNKLLYQNCKRPGYIKSIVHHILNKLYLRLSQMLFKS